MDDLGRRASPELMPSVRHPIRNRILTITTQVNMEADPSLVEPSANTILLADPLAVARETLKQQTR